MIRVCTAVGPSLASASLLRQNPRYSRHWKPMHELAMPGRVRARGRAAS